MIITVICPLIGYKQRKMPILFLDTNLFTIKYNEIMKPRSKNISKM
jgi:hypothetical protein